MSSSESPIPSSSMSMRVVDVSGELKEHFSLFFINLLRALNLFFSRSESG